MGFFHTNESTEPDRVIGTERNFPLLVIITITIGMAFFISDFDWQISTYPDYTVSASEAEARVAAGNPARRAAYALIGLLGGILLLKPGERRYLRHSVGPVLLAAYLIICCASVMWSDDPGLSVKRLAILGFCVLGILGLNRHLRAVDFMHMGLVIALVFLLVGVLAELIHGTLNPFAGDYRFAGTMHPNAQGAVCATLAIAAWCLARSSERIKASLLFLFAAGLFFLVLTKSRSSLLGCAIGVYGASFWGGSPGMRKFLAVGPPFMVCCGLLGAALLGFDVAGELDRAMYLGRETATSEIGSLSGRVPLWAVLLEYVGQQPLLGYGYHGFWTADRIFDVSRDMGWTVPNAHSVPLDIVLQVGLLGGICYGLGLLACIVYLAHRCLREGSPALIFAFAMALFALITSLLESSFADPTRFESFIAAGALFHAQFESEPVS